MNHPNRILLCEGQGSVHPGKGRDLFDRFPEFRSAFGEVQALTSIDLADISWGPNRFKTKSDPHLAHVYAFAHQYAQFRVLESRGETFRAATGHSLGELLALVLAGGLSIEEGFRFIDARGRLFSRNAATSGSDMVALIGEESKVRECLFMSSAPSSIHVANMNSPTQIVVAVKTAAIPALMGHSLSFSVRAVPLQIGNGCHSPFVQAIQGELDGVIDSLRLSRPAIPFYSSSFGFYPKEPEQIRACLKQHLMAPVDWRSSMAALLRTGAPFAELGYAKVLKGLALEMDRRCEVQMFESLVARQGAEVV